MGKGCGYKVPPVSEEFLATGGFGEQGQSLKIVDPVDLPYQKFTHHLFGLNVQINGIKNQKGWHIIG